MYNIDDIRNTIIHGNALETLRNIPDESVNCVVTSPPYWGLRFYGEETKTIWDGNPDCEHEWGEEIITARHKKGETNPGKEKWYKDNDAITPIAGNFCLKCGAWYGQLGLEPSLDMFIDHLLQITAELKRVLKKTGTLWWNMGDCYGSHSIGNGNVGGIEGQRNRTSKQYSDTIKAQSINKLLSVPDKCLALQNFRLAQRMIDEQGWILRNILIWHKLNSMPQSVKDRFTVDFEPVFFFVVSKKYYFEQQFEPFQESTYQRINYAFNPSKGDIQGAVKSSGQRKFAEHLKQGLLNGRNKRCVWTINTQPFKDAHFAVMPEKLVEPMIKAGCPKRIDYGYNACNCNVGFKPGIVLDPFMGAGTVAVVAKKLGRDYIGIELNPEYIKIAEKRIANTIVNETLFDVEKGYGT